MKQIEDQLVYYRIGTINVRSITLKYYCIYVIECFPKRSEIINHLVGIVKNILYHVATPSIYLSIVEKLQLLNEYH